MWLVWFAVALLALKLLGVDPVTSLSWWWVAAPFAAAFVWFEFIERPLGLDKKKAMDEMDATKKARIERVFERNKGAGRSK